MTRVSWISEEKWENVHETRTPYFSPALFPNRRDIKSHIQINDPNLTQLNKNQVSLSFFCFFRNCRLYRLYSFCYKKFEFRNFNSTIDFSTHFQRHEIRWSSRNYEAQTFKIPFKLSLSCTNTKDKFDLHIKQNQSSQNGYNVNHDFFTNNVLSFQSYQNKLVANNCIPYCMTYTDTIWGTILIFVTVWLEVLENFVLVELLAPCRDSRWTQLAQAYQNLQAGLFYQHRYILQRIDLISAREFHSSPLNIFEWPVRSEGLWFVTF